MIKRFSGDSGQATAEYALVIVAAAAVALALLVWALETDVLSDLFGAAVRRIRNFMP